MPPAGALDGWRREKGERSRRNQRVRSFSILEHFFASVSAWRVNPGRRLQLESLKSETPCELVKLWRQSLIKDEFARDGAKDAKGNFFFAGFAPSREPWSEATPREGIVQKRRTLFACASLPRGGTEAK